MPRRPPSRPLALLVSCLIALFLWPQQDTAMSAAPPAAAAADFARRGPLFGRLASPPEGEEWARHGAALVSQLAGEAQAAVPPEDLPVDLAKRVYHLYLPIYFWMRGQLREGKATVIGLSAPQGCGKTTLVTLLKDRFAADGRRCAAVSFDDFYLTGAKQDEVAANSPDNALLQVRGNAGTHDLELGADTLRALCGRDGGEVAVPSYDKALRGGRGDRAPADSWPREGLPLDAVLLEGWMAGFAPTGDKAGLTAIHPSLPEVDAGLGAYEAWHGLCDAWCVLALAEKESVFAWRLEAEKAMAAQGRPGMDDAAVRDFVSRYMPAYAAYCPGLYAAAAGGGVGGRPSLLAWVDGQRRPVEAL